MINSDQKTTLKTSENDFDVVLSLTTWSKRLNGNNVLETLKSLVNQKCNVRTKIVLNIFKDDLQYIKKDLKDYIEENNIEILEYSLDLKSHKKYFYVMQKYQYKPIVLFDDDLIYNDNIVQLLFDNYKKYPECVSARRCRGINYDKYGIALPYNYWNIFNRYGYPQSNTFLATTGGGTLFPPNILNISSKDLWIIEKFITSDDLFLKYKMDQKGIKVSYVYDPDNRQSFKCQKESADKSSLCFENVKYAKLNNTYIKLANIRDTKRNPEKIIISLTSWTKRINKVPNVIKTMYNNTIIPDVVILNLSEEEFPNRENDLSKELLEIKDIHESFEINWVGKNTKPYKKLIPTLEKYPNDIIITIDDDLEYTDNFIELLYYEFLIKGKKNPITGGDNKWRGRFYSHLGSGSLVKGEMFGPYLKDMYENLYLKNPEVFKFSDPLFTYAILLNNRRYIYLEKLNMKAIRRKNPNDEFSISKIESDTYKKEIKEEHSRIQRYIHDKYKIYIENIVNRG